MKDASHLRGFWKGAERGLPLSTELVINEMSMNNLCGQLQQKQWRVSPQPPGLEHRQEFAPSPYPPCSLPSPKPPPTPEGRDCIALGCLLSIYRDRWGALSCQEFIQLKVIAKLGPTDMRPKAGPWRQLALRLEEASCWMHLCLQPWERSGRGRGQRLDGAGPSSA